ncbi:putative isocitrate dehydrogenase (NAD) subunit alpha, mitochondrial [[Clostridium] ultunense Esp]|uniref:3-isopropylmalate/3-methylmalate dehydrogenase n=1 Tax=[Clostridium] ultunense Esp TaxID=1288971 RepID=M1ZL67_9FIRM|nr:isocitrate/isopropylmalate dehydrogenase family protein [Schnuerera ultunensis]CCQ96672.1 putative isocitrate dehydrogenase (NAD) subunit alpha, mitochondrial [[Clostridium] ultunense Esp]SHD77487.1 3-isopropylmalate/3-methylmalate dehydrogenase [[Clostridium] ultunense Esp]
MAYDITLIPGDGIGPEVISATVDIIEAVGVDINWDKVEAGANTIETEGTPLPDYVINSIKKNKIALKGPLTTPIGQGFRSVNVSLRKKLDLFANIRPVKSFNGIPSLHKDVDLIIVRENTEDLYAGVERMIDENRAESIKIITKKASERICRYAFQMARDLNRKKVTLVHKANIMKLSDGLFLESGRKIAKDYPDIEFEEVIVDAMSMKLVQFPQDYDVIVAPNLYGDILSDLAAGLIGGLGLAPSANIGEEIALFEPVHGSALDISNKNIANPISAILSGVLMLKHIGQFDAAVKIERALSVVLKDEANRTMDLGGKQGTKEFAEKVIEKVS